VPIIAAVIFLSRADNGYNGYHYPKMGGVVNAAMKVSAFDILTSAICDYAGRFTE